MMAKYNKMKKYGSLFMATALITGVLAGCGTDDDSSGGSGNTVSGDVIKIGANLELSGNVGSYGSSINDGAKLAIEEINAAGGIDGKKIEYVPVDNKSETAEATSAAIRLAEQEKVVAMLAPATSGNSVATVQIANKHKVPMVTGSGTSPNITVNDLC